MADTMAELDAAISASLDEVPDPEPSPSEPVAESPSAPEAEAVAETAPEAGSPPVASPSQSTTDEPEPWKNFLGKYNGDRAKAAEAYWQTNNRNAELARENEELKKRLSQPTEPGSPPEQPKAPEPPAVPQELQRFDETLRAHETRIKEIDTDIEKYRSAQKTLAQREKALNRLIVRPGLDFEEKERAEKELSILLDRQDQVERYLSHIEREKVDRERDVRLTTQERRYAQRDIEERQAREAQAERERTEQLKAFATSVYQEIQQTAAQVEPELREAFQEYAEGQCLRNPPTPDGVKAHVEKLRTRFLEIEDTSHRVRSAKYAKDKAADVSQGAPEGKAAVAPQQKKRGFANRREADDHIDRVMEAL